MPATVFAQTAGEMADKQAKEQSDGARVLTDQSRQDAINKGVYMPSLPMPSQVRDGVGDGLQAKFPLSNQEIEWVRKNMDSNQYAMHKSPALKPASRVLSVSVDPGSDPIVVRCMPGYVTALSVVGRDGTPWPIITSTPGSTAFDIASPAQATPNNKQDVNAPNNLLTIQPKFFGASTNVMLTLKGLSVPVILMIVSGKPDGTQVDGRITARINRMAPDAPPPLVMPPPPSPMNTTLLQFSEDTPPKSAISLSANGGNFQAWSWENSVIIRTTESMVLPAWIGQVQQDGVNVYQLPRTDSITLRTAQGKISYVLGDNHE